MQFAVDREDLQPLYFGPSGEALFGCYHAPVSPARNHAVVLCYPMGQEYIRAHRSFVLLARRLARRGFAVLRFDYFGTGDSAGDAEDGRLPRWIEDARAAIGEARRRSGAARVSIIGLRIGGTVAALAAAADGAVADLVLWDPVIHGRAHVSELSALQTDVLRYQYVTVSDTDAVVNGEVLGFPLPPELRVQIGAIDLTALQHAPAERVLLVESAGPVGLEEVRDALCAVTHFEHRRIDAARIWLTETFDGIVAQPVLEAVVEWIEQPSS